MEGSQGVELRTGVLSLHLSSIPPLGSVGQAAACGQSVCSPVLCDYLQARGFFDPAVLLDGAN